MDEIVISLIKGGGVSGTLIAIALVYLAVQVRHLNDAVDGVRQTIGAQVFPRLDALTKDVFVLKGRFEAQDNNQQEERHNG